MEVGDFQSLVFLRTGILQNFCDKIYMSIPFLSKFWPAFITLLLTTWHALNLYKGFNVFYSKKCTLLHQTRPLIDL